MKILTLLAFVLLRTDFAAAAPRNAERDLFCTIDSYYGSYNNAPGKSFCSSYLKKTITATSTVTALATLSTSTTLPDVTTTSTATNTLYYYTETTTTSTFTYGTVTITTTVTPPANVGKRALVPSSIVSSVCSCLLGSSIPSTTTVVYTTASVTVTDVSTYDPTTTSTTVTTTSTSVPQFYTRTVFAPPTGPPPSTTVTETRDADCFGTVPVPAQTIDFSDLTVGEPIDPATSYHGVKFSRGSISGFTNFDSPPSLAWYQYTGNLVITPGQRDEFCPYSWLSIKSFDFFLQNSTNYGPVVVTCHDKFGAPYNTQINVPAGGATITLPSSITSIQAVDCWIQGFGNGVGTFYNVIDNIVFQ